MMQTMTMTGKYKRKSVTENLEVRGISRGFGGGNLLHVARSDNLGGNSLIPQECLDTLNHAISEFDTESAESEHSSAITGKHLETGNPRWIANLTGNTTDRSSSNSTVTYDDFDREASDNVLKLFDAIDSMLFESASSTGMSSSSTGKSLGATGKLSSSNYNDNSQLYDECNNWSQSFPHMRILGVQMVPSSEQGYHQIDTAPTSATSTSSSAEHNSYSFSGGDNSLVVEGNELGLHRHPTCTSTYDTHSDSSHLDEDILVIDGYYEEIIAIDSDMPEDSPDSKSRDVSYRQRRSQRYPPITPNASVKDHIVHAVFEPIWRSMTIAVRTLLQKYSESFFINHPMHIEAIEAADEVLDVHPVNYLKLPQIPVSESRVDNFMPIIGHGGHRFIPGSVLSRPSLYSISPQATQANDKLLGKILQISKVEMSEKKKEKTFLEDGTETPTLIGSMHMSSKKSSGAGNMSANKRVFARNLKLMPINSDRSRTPNVDDEPNLQILRGQRITAHDKRLGSPPVLGSKMLPPIHQSDLPLPSSAAAIAAIGAAANTAASSAAVGQAEMILSRPRGIAPKRSNSAIAEKDARPSQRDRAMITETRPSTTHTVYPTDSLSIALSTQQRSSTPLDKASFKLKHDVSLGITGSSLIGPNTVLDEEAENRYDAMNHHSQWAPAPHTATGTYRRSTNKTFHSMVR